MPHHLNSFIALSMIATASCCAMEKQSPLKELTITTNPRQALYLTNNRLVISEKQGCRIIDPTTNTEVRKINDSSFPHIAIHPNNKKIALTDAQTVTIYDGETGIIEKEIINPLKNETSIISSIFSSTDDSIFIRLTNAQIICIEYKKNKLFIAGWTENQTKPAMLTFHPTQEKRCYGQDHGKLIVYDENAHRSKLLFNMGEPYKFCSYSPDGSVIAAGNQDNIYILNPNIEVKISHYYDYRKNFILPKDPNEQLIDMAFHPNSSVLVTLSSPSNVLCYWDVAARQLLKKMEPLTITKHDCYQHLSFAPNGKNIMVIADNKCGSMPVPFEAIYQTEAKEKIAFTYWLLKNYTHDQHDMLPTDITYLLINNLLECYKR